MNRLHQIYTRAAASAVLAGALLLFLAPGASAQSGRSRQRSQQQGNQRGNGYQQGSQHGNSYQQGNQHGNSYQQGNQRGNSYQQWYSYPSGGYQQPYISNGYEYYWYNGQEWALNLAFGTRQPVVQYNNSYNSLSSYVTYPSARYTYYTYKGNRYVMNRRTGTRRMLR
jgi:hypothetical protein